MIRFDENSFQHTAKAVFIMNESARERYDYWVELEKFMESLARVYASSKTTSLSTGGFQLTFTRDTEKDDVYVVASVSGYTAMRYFDLHKETA